jgi:hypothetical protein
VAGIGQYSLDHLGNAELVVNDQDERHASPSPLTRAFCQRISGIGALAWGPRRATGRWQG